MRKIRLEPVLEFGSRCELAIIDVTESESDETGKKRGTITIDYSPADVRQLITEGRNLEGALDYYRDRIYNLVKYYISGDWEDAGGYENALSLVRKHIETYF